MPLYEYYCYDCGEVFEKMIRFSEADRDPACPTCESKNTHKKISKVASLSSSPSTTIGSSSSGCGSHGGFT